MNRIMILLILSVISCHKVNDKKNNFSSWKLIYKIDPNGNKIKGSKELLITAVKNGTPVRIGWKLISKKDTTKSVEHVIDTNLLTILNEEELFVQLNSFYAQKPSLKRDSLKIDLIPIESTWCLSTKGLISSININSENQEISKFESAGFKTEISWYCKTNF
ncbi:conserved hypothetical protein [Tenacibaculum sp. 190524A05c]|uniref:hypothetical protein n=1 Tax=Tenacibaculum platacis TaxID=3137852 RepID=UPI0031FB6551